MMSHSIIIISYEPQLLLCIQQIYTTLVLSHLKIAINKLLALWVWGLSVINFLRPRLRSYICTGVVNKVSNTRTELEPPSRKVWLRAWVQMHFSSGEILLWDVFWSAKHWTSCILHVLYHFLLLGIVILNGTTHVATYMCILLTLTFVYWYICT